MNDEQQTLQILRRAMLEGGDVKTQLARIDARHDEVQELVDEVRRRLAAISGAPAKAPLLDIVHAVEQRMAQWRKMASTNAIPPEGDPMPGELRMLISSTRWLHESDVNNEKFLGAWADPVTLRSFDLYFRPKPTDTNIGFIDAIVARYGNGKYDCRIGAADKVSLEEREHDADDTGRALRVGRLIANDLGLMV